MDDVENKKGIHKNPFSASDELYFIISLRKRKLHEGLRIPGL